jgi:hypothetical protein
MACVRSFIVYVGFIGMTRLSVEVLEIQFGLSQFFFDPYIDLSGPDFIACGIFPTTSETEKAVQKKETIR